MLPAEPNDIQQKGADSPLLPNAHPAPPRPTLTNVAQRPHKGFVVGAGGQAQVEVDFVAALGVRGGQAEEQEEEGGEQARLPPQRTLRRHRRVSSWRVQEKPGSRAFFTPTLCLLWCSSRRDAATQELQQRRVWVLAKSGGGRRKLSPS